MQRSDFFIKLISIIILVAMILYVGLRAVDSLRQPMQTVQVSRATVETGSSVSGWAVREETVVYGGGYETATDVPVLSEYLSGFDSSVKGEKTMTLTFGGLDVTLPYRVIDDAEAEEAFTNAVSGTLIPDVFYLYRDNVRTKSLPVPEGQPKECCPCPEHKQSNYVAKVAYSGRVAVKDAAGEDFYISHEPCTVTLSGVSPSRDFGDSTVVFVTNGVECSRHNYTVLGVKIDRPSWMTPVDRYGQLSASFGFPVEVCSNLYDASELVLRTDVLLDGGYVRLALENATGDFEIWLQDWYDKQYTWHEPEKLLDGTS